MKTPTIPRKIREKDANGFALVVSLTMLVLLTVIAVGLLSLSAITLRTTTQTSALADAQANARLALMVAIGELQKEMGPDMRISMESAIFDTDPNTEAIQGVDQSRWLGTYNSWGSWLNADYELPDGGPTMNIAGTYTSRREAMFRRWLLSLPNQMELDVNAPNSIGDWDDSNSIVLVGEGTLGINGASDNPHEVTRAYLKNLGEEDAPDGKYAWWISPENHRARVNLGKLDEQLSLAQLESSQGNTNEVAVSLLEGFDILEQNPDARGLIFSEKTIEAAGIDLAISQPSFFDLSAHSQGVLSSVRTGRLKKDLSLLFELDNSQLPETHRFNAQSDQEPSIRPMSIDLAGNNPHIDFRHFASWTNMRHYHRMYRSDSDANPGGTAGTGGSGNLNWFRNKPWTNIATRAGINHYDNWKGHNKYQRIPILAKATYIYSLQTEQIPDNTNHRLFLVYTPVFTFWNPYNVEMRIPHDTLQILSGAYQCLPLGARFYLDNEMEQKWDGGFGSYNPAGKLQAANQQYVSFEPGQFKVFTPRSIGGSFNENLFGGFDPLGINAGDRLRIGANSGYDPNSNPGLSLQFGDARGAFNVNFGNTPGSFVFVHDWDTNARRIPIMYNNDWFQRIQQFTPITPDPVTVPDDIGGQARRAQNIERWIFDGAIRPIAYAQLVIKGISEFDYSSITWNQDWRSRNWLHAPPQYFGSAMYVSESTSTAHTQRLDSPYIMNFGPLSDLGEAVALADPFQDPSRAILGSGPDPQERIASVAMLDLPSAPSGSLASFSGMRINPGWYDASKISWLRMDELRGLGTSTREASFRLAEAKAIAYQSGVTGPGIGNSFIHPMIPRTDIYRDYDNSRSQDPVNRGQMGPGDAFQENDNRVFRDYWDHVFLLNDALWDDYFVSSISDQSRPGQSGQPDLNGSIDNLLENGKANNTRIRLRAASADAHNTIKDELAGAEGYLKAAKHLMVDGMFNVNSTSVSAWYALFAGIRDRDVVFRNQNGGLEKVVVPEGKRIALSRFDTEISKNEVTDPLVGAEMADGWSGWSGVRFLSDTQLKKLAEECVKQVKLRGPFLNFSEFINRRLSDDELGVMGALQSAIDYDDESPDSDSINYRFKANRDYLISPNDLGPHEFATPEAINGSRFAGIPGYVIQSDILRPIANTLSVRDDTFRIRAYGESLDSRGNTLARAWCEAIVQRVPDYTDPSNSPEEPAKTIGPAGDFAENNELSTMNRIYGRKFEIISFRWLNPSEV